MTIEKGTRLTCKSVVGCISWVNFTNTGRISISQSKQETVAVPEML